MSRRHQAWGARAAGFALGILSVACLPARAEPYGWDAPRPARLPGIRVPDPRAPLPSPALSSTLPFAATCSQPTPNATRAIARDAAGAVYVVAICGGEVQLCVSQDDGATWTPPLTIGNGEAMTVAGGGAGSSIVAWSAVGTILERHSADFGRTFTPEQVVIPAPTLASQGLDALAAGGRFHVMAAVGDGSGARLTRSVDSGASWEPPISVTSPWVYGDLLYDALTGNVELVSDNPSVYRSTSADGGASFPPYQPLDGTCCIYYSDWAMGCGLISATGGTDSSGLAPDLTWRWDVAAGTPVQMLATLPPTTSGSRSSAVDEQGDLFTVGQVAGTIEMARWRSGSASVDPGIVLAGAGTNPHLTTCGAGTSLVVYHDGTGIQFVSSCLDGPCCAPGACGAPPVLTLLRNADLTRLRSPLPPLPPLPSFLAEGDGTGRAGATALDRTSPAERFPGFSPGLIPGEIGRTSPLVYYELEEPDAASRTLRLAKSGSDLDVRF